MQSNKAAKSKITFKTKITLVIFVFFLFLIFLEIGLRMVGFALLSMQDYRNTQSLKQKGSYCIMCLGESMTRGEYPSIFENILNQQNIGIKFSVIDKGLDGTTTSAILERLNSNIDKYHPDAVVTMMGINDERITYEAPTASKSTLFFRSFKTYKLANILWLNILAKAKEIEDSFRKTIELYPNNYKAHLEMAESYVHQGKFFPAENAFRETIIIQPENYYAYFKLGQLYKAKGKYSQAEDLFKKAIELNCKDSEVYFELGKVYENLGKYSQAEDLFKKGVDVDRVKKVNTQRPENFNSVTVNNFCMFKDILDKRKIRYVCMQYPMISIEPLKKIFGDNKQGIIFVDNETIFRDVVKKYGYNAYFQDMFGGAFGHCTEKGNRLLAENLANVILKEVFGK